MELSLLRQRSLEALRQKARRGELFLGVVVGYVKKVRHDRIAKDPDRRVQEALGLVFRKFAEFESVRQVNLWLRQEDVRLPAVKVNGDGGCGAHPDSGRPRQAGSVATFAPSLPHRPGRDSRPGLFLVRPSSVVVCPLGRFLRRSGRPAPVGHVREPNGCRSS